MNTHASFNESDESIECCKSNIKLIVDMITFGKGTLYVTKSKLYWKNKANSQVISINYDIMCKYYVSHYPGRRKKSCLKMIVDYNYKPDEFDLIEDEEEEKFKSIIKLVPKNPECLDAIFEAIACIQPLHLSDNVVNEKTESDEHKDSDKKSNTTITSTCTQEDQEAGSIDISNQYHKLDEKNGEKGNQVNSIKCLDIPHSPSDSVDDNEYSHVQPLHLSDNVVDEESETDEHEDFDKKSNTSITSTSTQEDQEADSIDISNQYHKLDEKNGEKGNQVKSIKCLDIPHTSSDSLDDNEYSHVQPLHLSDNVVDEESETDEHEDFDKKSNTSITSTSTQEDQEADSIDISNQYHKLDEKNGEKGNQVKSIKCLDIPHSPSDSLDDNEYSHVQPLHLSDSVVDEESETDEHEDFDKKSNTSITSTSTQEDQEADSIDISNQYHKLDEKNGEKGNQVKSIKCLDISHTSSDSLDDNEYSHFQPLHLSDSVVDEESETDEHEDFDKKSNTSITSTSTQEDQEAGSIDISNQYHKLDEKNGEKGNQVNSIKCLDIPHTSSDSLDDNEYSHESENDDLELNNMKSPNWLFNISPRAPLHPDVDLDTAFEDDILLQDEDLLIRPPTTHLMISSRAPLHPDVDLATAFEDEEVLINKRKRKFEDLPEQKEKPTKIRKLWNFMKYPFQKITSFSTSISENEPNISNFSLNNSEADGENEDTSTNETSQHLCKIM